MSDIYTVIPYGRKWAVKRPDGTLRCVVKTRDLARTVARECSHAIVNDHPRVICVETGKVYPSTREAAASIGLTKRCITQAIASGRRS